MSCYRMLPGALPDDDPVERVEHLHLEPVPRSVREARSFVAQQAPPLADDARDALLLLTSELVTNAVIHARTTLEVGLTVSRTHVLVTVHDQDTVRREQEPYPRREGGWGLGMVRALAEHSALDRHAEGDGKTAWFRLRREGGPRAVGDGEAARVG